MSDKRTEYIIDWVKGNRSDVRNDVIRLLKSQAHSFLMYIWFEAGRKFQHDNPNLTLDNPNVYSDDFKNSFKYGR